MFFKDALINVIESSWLSKPQQLPLFTTGSHNRLFPAGTAESSKYPSKVQRYVVIKRNFKKTCKKVSSKTSGMQISRIHASRAGSDGVFQLRIGSGSVIGKKSTQTYFCQLQTQPLERRREVVKEIQENSSTGQAEVLLKSSSLWWPAIPRRVMLCPSIQRLILKIKSIFFLISFLSGAPLIVLP